MLCTVEITTAEDITYIVRNVISIRIHQNPSLADWSIALKRVDGNELNYVNVNPVTGFRILEYHSMREEK